jgi:hypothetical protein
MERFFMAWWRSKQENELRNRIISFLVSQSWNEDSDTILAPYYNCDDSYKEWVKLDYYARLKEQLEKHSTKDLQALEALCIRRGRI